MISIRRFYRLAMLIPLVVTAVTLIGWDVFGQAIYPPLDALQIVLGIFGLFGALPYCVLALWAWHWMKNKSEREIRRLVLLMPLLLAGLCVPIALIIGIASRGDEWDTIFWIGGLVLAYAVPASLILGYAYVALAFLLRHIAQTQHWVAADLADPV
ncbi:MAG: hypothetical protein ACREMS_02650 [Gemmatimonadaceae bacterium]